VVTLVKAIIGLKGSGKTKKLIDLVTEAVRADHGDVVCIEKEPQLTFDIPHKARLIFASEFDFTTFEYMKGFLSGLRAGNYDITDVFIDNLFKIVKENSDESVISFLDWLDAFGKKENIKFTLTISADADTAPEGIKKYA